MNFLLKITKKIYTSKTFQTCFILQKLFFFYKFHNYLRFYYGYLMILHIDVKKCLIINNSISISFISFSCNQDAISGNWLSTLLNVCFTFSSSRLRMFRVASTIDFWFMQSSFHCKRRWWCLKFVRHNPNSEYQIVN